VVLTLGAITLALAVAFALVVWTLVSAHLVASSTALAVQDSTHNAEAVAAGLEQPSPRVPEVLDGLGLGPGSSAFVRRGGAWFASSRSVAAVDMPVEAVELADSGRPGTRRVEVGGEPMLAVGVPLPHGAGSYVELVPRAALEHTLGRLRMILVVPVLGMGAAAMVVGGFASRLALRPLATLTLAAAVAARGETDVRLEAEDDPDLRGLARSFNETADQLRQRRLADARFAGDVSHELRTPLTTMLNSLQVIANRRSELPVTVREALDLLTEDVERFRRLVVDLIEISRSDGGDRLNLETVRIGQAVGRAADTAAGREVARVAPSAESLAMTVDKRRLERLVTNLVENADHHGGGCIGVSVTGAGRVVRILVDDAGPGIEEDRRQRVFERFVRTGRSAGSGLGLAIVVRHVLAHHGRVWVTDRPGGGARFVVELPVDGG
jgi:signal transduction histidine kinase